MQGSIQKRTLKSGATRWSVVYDEPTPSGRRQRRKTVRTKKEAEVFLAKALHEIQVGSYVEPSDHTVASYLTYWLEHAARTAVRATTFRSYEQQVRVHLMDTIGPVPLQRLQAGHLQSLYLQKLATGRADGQGGLSPRSVRYLHTILRAALQQALRWGWVVKNVADAAEAPRADRPTIKTWGDEEMRRFLAASKADTYGPLWALALSTGMRRGELLGLRWQDLDLPNARLHVRQSLVEIGSELRIHEPKTSSGRRMIPLPPEMVPLLTTHRTREVERRRLLGIDVRDQDLVFTTSIGSPVAPRNLHRLFKRLIADAGLPQVTMHGLRHSHATQLIGDNIPTKVVSERLGHASIALTLDTYAHVLPGMQATAVDSVSRALFGTTTAEPELAA